MKHVAHFCNNNNISLMWLDYYFEGERKFPAYAHKKTRGLRWDYLATTYLICNQVQSFTNVTKQI